MATAVADAEVCLNCGATQVDAFCAACGQRHVPLERYDIRGLAIDYSVEVVGKLTLLRTVYALFRHPGAMTEAYMGGHRKSQVNPLWLFLFLWSTLITLLHFALSPESADFMQMPNEDVLAAMKAVQPWFLGVMAYTTPLASLVATVLAVRALATRSWLEASVYALHVETVGLVLMLPSAIAMARLGVWSSGSLVGYALSMLSVVPLWIYSWLALRRVFGHLDRFFLRWLGITVLGFSLSLLWSLVLSVGLWIVLGVMIVMELA